MSRKCYKFAIGTSGLRYHLVLLYKYFEKGYGLTSYIKWVVAIFGMTSLNIKLTMVFLCFYGISCFFVGWVWFYYGFYTAENEVNNQFNLFVKEMRKKIK